MCLSLERNAPRPVAPTTVYKHLLRSDHEKEPNLVTSPYQGYTYDLVPGEEIVSNRSDTALTEIELASSQVHKGFHVFLTSRDAYNDSWSAVDCVVAEFQGAPEDFVAVGDFSGDPSMVFTKLKFVKFLN